MASDTGRLRVLLVEANTDFAAQIERELASSGLEYALRRVGDEREFAAALDDSGPTDLVLVDDATSGVTARRALDILQRHSIDVPIILVSSARGDEAVVECLKAGIADVVLIDRLARLSSAIAHAFDTQREEQAARVSDRMLRENERRFRHLAEHASDVIYRRRLYPDSAVEYISPSVATILGYPPEAFYHDPFFTLSIVHPDDREQMRERWLGGPPSESIRFVHRDGHTVLLEHRTALERDHEGRIVAIEGIARDVTATKLVEERLLTSDAIIRNMGALVLIADTNGLISYASPSMTRALGYDPAEVLGDGWWRLSSVDGHSDQERERLIALPRTQSIPAGSYERPARAADGTVHWIQWQDAFGPDGSIIGVGQDITDRKHAECERARLVHELARSEAKYRALVERLPAVTYAISDGAGAESIYVSPQIETLSGYSPEEWERNPKFWREIVLSEDRDEAMRRLADAHASGSFVRSEYRIRRKDGAIVWVRDEARVVRDDDGRPVCVQGVVLDITAQRAAEDHARLEQNFRAAIERSMGAGVAAIDLDGRLTYANPAFAQMVGWNECDLVGRTPPFPFWPDEERDAIVDAFEQATREKAAHATFELRFCRRSGERFDAMIILSPLTDAGGQTTGWLASFNDITDRKRLEAEYRQAQKLEAVGRLAAGVAHDFNNLLTAILGYGELLEHSLKGTAHEKDLCEIRKAAESAGRLTRQLLSFSRKQIVAPTALDVNGVVEHVDSMLRRVIGEDIALELALDRRVPLVKCDAGQIEQVLMNLAVNARDAMPGGGRLTISTRTDQLQQGAAGAHAAGAYVVLAIADTGCGMDEATKSHIFEPFFTTKEAGKGTGLGLATVYSIVEQSGGFVRVKSEVGEGTTFEVLLPPRAYETQARAAAGDAQRATAAGGELVLIAEDEEMVRTLASRVLERHGYKVRAGTPIECLRLIESNQARVDLLITDVVMPDMSGVELADRVRQRCPGVRVLFMSGYTDHPALIRQVVDHPATFINKPFTPAGLASKVRELLSVSAPLAARSE